MTDRPAHDNSDWHRGDGAHRSSPVSGEAWEHTDGTYSDETNEPVEPLHSSEPMHPSESLGPQCPRAVDKLELLDDTVFEAIAGKPEALEQLRKLWPAVMAEVGADMIAESRAQYLRHAMNVWRGCTEGDEVRNPRLAINAMEVVSLLLGE